MSRHGRSRDPARSVLLMVSTLAVVGVVFAIYVQYARTPTERGGGTGRIAHPPIAPARTEPTQSAITGSAMEIQGVPVHQGGRIRINMYGPEGDRPRAQLEVDSFEPVGPTGSELRLENPSIRFRTPAGQLLNVTADRGRVEKSGQRGTDFDLTRGRLEGHVTIVMDRLDEEQRAQLPPEERDQLSAERTVRVELDDLTFDLEYARVESSGDIHVVLAEAEFEGRELHLRYDEARSRIEYLRIARGGRITLRELGASLSITLPGAARAERAELEAADAGESIAATEPATVPPVQAEASPVVEDDGVPLFVPEVPERPRVRETVTYTARFDNDVVVDQFEGTTQTGFLTADQLLFLFDFGQQQRDLARGLPGARSPGDASSTGPSVLGPDDTESTVVLQWRGPLIVDLVRASAEGPPDAFGERLHITASGREVRVADRQGSAQCAKLVYHYESERAWLYGSDDRSFVLDIGAGGHLSGAELVFDPLGQTATVTGPGVLSDEDGGGMFGSAAPGSRGRGGEVSVSFDREMRLCLGSQEIEKIDPITGGLVPVRREYLQSAELSGDVAVHQEDGRIAAQRVEIGFGPPGPGTPVADSIERLHAEGSVQMVQGQERIACRAIDVTLGRDPGGRVVPTRAEAVGDVVAAQGARAISASERMVVLLESVPAEKPPFDRVRARIEAVRRGVDVQAIDWDTQREKYERERRYVLGLRRLQAYGDVSADDPDGRLYIDAGRLDCEFENGRRIERGMVRGKGLAPASVTFGDFSIMGEEIEFDAGVEWAEVPGPGRMTFISRKDLDGRSLVEPIPVSVTWNGSMTFRGRQNTAMFTELVHAASESSTFDCRELVLDFVDVEPEPDEQTASADPRDWWIVNLFRPRSLGEGRLKIEAPAIRKQLAYVSARGDVVGLTTSYDETGIALKTRARLAGPHLAVDLRDRTQAMTIDDAGTLLIEDYRLREPDDSAKPAKLSPFGAAGENLPSQTFIAWQGAMSFYGSNRLAVFEKDVELVYRSGSKLMLADGVLDAVGLARLRQSEGGRDARLLCEQMNVQFLKRRDRSGSPPDRGLGGMSGNEVASFAASGGAYFEDSGVSVTCRTITFDRERNLLQILGNHTQPAELIDQRNGRYRSITGPTIYWERDTDRIEAPRSTIRAH